jgi:hypothetical protein
MDGLCLPAVTTAALFIALLFLDMFRKEFRLLPGHMIFGALATALMTFICSSGSEFTAWILLATPAILVTVGWAIMAMKPHGGAPTVIPRMPKTKPAGCMWNGKWMYKAPCCVNPRELTPA